MYFRGFLRSHPFFSWGDILHIVEMNMNHVTLAGGFKVNETYKRVGGIILDTLVNTQIFEVAKGCCKYMNHLYLLL